ncbi:MAG: right-handed parallel beta-helix repeat-containing protein [bacterium]|nr:right-handed parallel beta-helix repeat-containing protein [bacterium]
MSSRASPAATAPLAAATALAWLLASGEPANGQQPTRGTSTRPPVVLHVAPHGTTPNGGSAAAPTDLRTALAKAEALTNTQQAVEIRLRGGRYRYRECFRVRSRGAALTIRPAADHVVVFDGSLQVDAKRFAAVTDPDERARLATAAADRIIAQTITDDYLARRLGERLVMPILLDGQPCLPARFPNAGYATLQENVLEPEISPPAVPSGREAYGVRAGHAPFQETGKRAGWLGSLAEPRGAWVRIGERADELAGSWQQWAAEIGRNSARNQLTGFLDANWLRKSQPIVAADADRAAFRLSQALAYGWSWRQRGKPFFVHGLLCELDAPGEWHFDPLTRRLYLMPFRAIDAATRIDLPVAAGCFRLEQAEQVTLAGFTIERAASGTLVEFVGGSDNTAAGLVLRTASALGARITGTRQRVQSCDLYDLDAHIRLAGGERGPGTLLAGHNVVENCHCYQREFRHRRVQIGISGVGNRLRNNLVHNSLGQAVTVRGNDHELERNELFNIGYEEGDGGAIYAGGDLTGYGTIYRHNFIHHLMHKPGKVERSGIHLDDLQAGAECVGNVFYKSAGKGIFMNGGAGNMIAGNVFVAGYRGAYNVGHGAQSNHDRQTAIRADDNHDYRGKKEDYVGNAERIVGVEGWNRDPWLTRYPRFALVMNDSGQFGRLWPIRCVVKHNVYCNNIVANATIWSRVAPAARAKSVIEDDRIVTAEAFVDPSALDLRFRDHGANLPRIPFERIGLYVDRHRPSRPDPAAYRRTVADFFAGIPCMPGTDTVLDSAAVIDAAPRLSR